MSVDSEFSDILLDHSLLGQGSQLGDSGASGVYRHKGFLELLFKNFPSPEARGVLGESLFVIVCGPRLSYSFLHVREAKGDSLLVIVVDVVVDQQVGLD